MNEEEINKALEVIRAEFGDTALAGVAKNWLDKDEPYDLVKDCMEQHKFCLAANMELKRVEYTNGGLMFIYGGKCPSREVRCSSYGDEGYTDMYVDGKHSGQFGWTSGPDSWKRWLDGEDLQNYGYRHLDLNVVMKALNEK